MKALVTLTLVCGALIATTVINEDKTYNEATQTRYMGGPVMHYRDGEQVAEYPSLEDAAIIANIPEDSLRAVIDNNLNLMGDVYSFK